MSRDSYTDQLTDGLTHDQFEQYMLNPDSMAEIDELELKMIECLPPAEPEIEHLFTPGLYIRTMITKKGMLRTSKIHKTEHPFIISKGAVSIWTENAGTIFIQAPFIGVTKPGTRRVAYSHEDTVWTTIHLNPDDTHDLDVIEQRVIFHRINPKLGVSYARLKETV